MRLLPWSISLFVQLVLIFPVMAKTATVMGTAHDENGKPVQYVHVWLQWPCHGGYTRETPQAYTKCLSGALRTEQDGSMMAAVELLGGRNEASKKNSTAKPLDS